MKMVLLKDFYKVKSGKTNLCKCKIKKAKVSRLGWGREHTMSYMAFKLSLVSSKSNKQKMKFNIFELKKLCWKKANF